jgi:hypothetical protein
MADEGDASRGAGGRVVIGHRMKPEGVTEARERG